MGTGRRGHSEGMRGKMGRNGEGRFVDAGASWLVGAEEEAFLVRDEAGDGFFGRVFGVILAAFEM